MSSGDSVADSREQRDADQQSQCIICNQPNHADRKMVQCDGCDHWFHFRCVGVNDSIEDPERSFKCAACTVPDPPGSTVSTSASVREARIQLEVQRLADEKRLQEKMHAEREKQERDLLEMTLRLERERRDKAMKEKFALEKDYLQRKYDLLHTQLDDDGDAVSVRSRYQPRSERVVDWITSNPAVTMSANTGTIPTGLTSQLEPITHSMQQTSASAITNANRVHPAPGFISKVPPTAPSTTTSDSTPLPCYSNASITQAAMQNPVASVQQNFPSTSIDTSNMFVISPTIVSTASLSLPPLPTLPVRTGVILISTTTTVSNSIRAIIIVVSDRYITHCCGVVFTIRRNSISVATIDVR